MTGEDHEEYDLTVLFTKESRHGRMKTGRVAGASLTKTEPEIWDSEHKELPDPAAPEQFEVLRYAALSVLRKKAGME